MSTFRKYKSYYKKYKDVLLPAIVLLIMILGYQIYVLANLSEKESTPLTISTIITNLISILGSVASLVGLIIAYLQIKKIRANASETEKITRETKEKIEFAIKSVKELSTVSKLNRTVNLVRETQGYLTSKNLIPSLIRMRDIKSLIINISDDKGLKNITNQRSFKSLRNLFEIDLQNLNDLTNDNKTKVDLKVIIKNLEKIATELITIESQIINNKYEQN